MTESATALSRNLGEGAVPRRVERSVFAVAPMMIWTTGEREALGLYEISEDPIPDGKTGRTSTIIDRDGRPVRVYELVDLPPPPPVEITADVLFGERMTDEEYDAVDASIRAGETARVYRGWTAATVFTEGSAMWTLLDKHLSLVVTAERKAELLARPVQSAALAGDEALAA